jgi:hypothetical protein
MYRKFIRIITFVAVFAIAFSSVMPAAANQGNGNGQKNFDQEFTSGVYIVQLLDDPVVAYDGSIAGYKATKPNEGEKIKPKDGKVVRYVNYLISKHEEAINKAGGGEKFYDYTYAFNGFAAFLTAAQAEKMAYLPGVLAIELDEMAYVDTSSTPEFLGLDASGGIWEQLGGPEGAGEDVIVGIVDTGLWPEHPSFSEQIDLSNQTGNSGKRSLAYGPPPADWNGDCQSGEQWSQDDCTNKVIGARYFLDGFGHYGIIQNDYKSARDFHGHGSHTASTAAGNYDVPVTGDAATFGTISGMAPRARIAVYKVCWNGDDGGCANSDSVAAIDQAVADGVDVINFSISGTRTDFLSAVEVAFLFAADAGIFVAASAGNSGPGSYTVAHPSPWITTVAASTHDRFFESYVTLGGDDTVKYYGASVNTTGAGPADLVYAGDAGDALCYPGSLDPSLVTGKIVLCDRGAIARVDKSLAVYMAGGIGMIHANVSPSSINGDLHSVPTVHVDDVDGAVIRAYAQTAGATAEIFPSYDASPAPAPEIAAFSSRGPLQAGSGDILKPDVSAPGVDILAAVAPPSNAGRLFDLYSGTSMSSPHVAGLAALLIDKYPGWSPMMVKSALMTTGFDLLSGADPFAQGAGHVEPNTAADPGLVYDSDFFDWLSFLCGTTNGVSQGTCDFLEGIGYSLDPSDLNLASFAIGALPYEQTVNRTVINVGSLSETYSFSAAVVGIDVTANPSSFTLAPGETQEYTLTFTVNGAALNTYATGFATWTGNEGHIVRSPVAVRPVALAFPTEVAGAGTDGSLSFDLTFGYTGSYTAAPLGLVPADMQPGYVVDDPANNINVALGTGVGITWHTVTIPAGSDYLRISLFDEYTDGNDDLDLYVWNSSWGFVGSSGSGTSAEEVNVPAPTDTTYNVAVHGWQTDGPDANYTLFSWGFGPDAGNMTITGAPAPVNSGDTAILTVDWSGLVAGTKYLGAISHSDGTDLGWTLIGVDTD